MASTPPAVTVGDDELLAAFDGRVAAVPVSRAYRGALFVVAIAMVLLPLLYIALVLLAAAGVYHHATENADLFDGTGGILLYLAPLIAGVILVLFMVKPLFAPRALERKAYQLDPQQEPLLFAFVERLCRVVGAPRPKVIQVDCEVNASAAFRRGVWSLAGDDLVLTIGLPLAAGLNARQLAGVLAHEFGHFAQQAGMRLTYVIRTVSFWFARVVYERDRWDERLVAWTGAFDFRLSVVFYLARFFVWITRKILWVLMMIGQLLSCILLRQMELDADRYEARLAGSDTFEQTARRLPLLAVAAQGAQMDLEEFWHDRRLADDLPALIIANERQLERAVREQLLEEVLAAKTGLLDTHPCTSERIESAGRERAAGVFTAEQPANVLFGDFAQLSRRVTWDHYEALFGNDLSREQLRPVAALLARQKRQLAEFEAQRRYFQDVVSPLRPLPLSRYEIAPPADVDGAAATVRELRGELLGAQAGYRTTFVRYDQLDTELVRVEQADVLIDAGFRFDAAHFQLSSATRNAVRQAKERIDIGLGRLQPELLGPEELGARRLLAALELLQAPQVAAGVDDGDALAQESRRLLPLLARVAGALPRASALRNRVARLRVLFDQVDGERVEQNLFSTIMVEAAATRTGLAELLEPLGGLPYPFEHGLGNLDVRTHLAGDLPPAEEAWGVLDAAAQAVEKLYYLYGRVVGRLAFAAEAVERHLGLEPLPDPPRQEVAGDADA